LKKQEHHEQSKAYAKMPGRMGHATCVVVRIGELILSKNIPVDIPLSMSAEAMQRVERKKLLKQSAFQKFQPTMNKSGDKILAPSSVSLLKKEDDE